jgi:hypothetical protein
MVLEGLEGCGGERANERFDNKVLRAESGEVNDI